MKTDVALIKPGNQKKIYGELSNHELTAIEPPMWIAIWAGFLRQQGYSVAVYDEEIQGQGHQHTARWVQDVDPWLAVVVVSGSNPSASTMNMDAAGEIISCIKDTGCDARTMLAGLHPSALPEKTVLEGNADYVCQGEGFATLPAAIDAVKGGDKKPRIEGLWYKDNDKVVSNPMSQKLADLNDIGMPAWDLFDLRQYRAHNWHCFDDIENRQPYAVLYTSLGCPFKCSFCCINAIFGTHTIRYRPIDHVMGDIDFFVNEYGVKNIKIIDEMFAMNEKRVIELCDQIIERGYDLNMWAYARVNTVTEKMLAKMKQAGVNWLAYGFESASSRVINDVTKGYKLDQVEKVVNLSYKLGFYICANYIFGLPEDDYGSMNETLQSMLSLNAEWANIYSAMAYPGSQLYELALENHWPLPQSWDGFSQYAFDSLPLPTNYLRGGQVLGFRDHAFNVYYNNPEYLNMIKRKFGLAAYDHIKRMTAKTLLRKNAEPVQM